MSGKAAIRFIVPGKIYNDSFAENVVFTLRKMGYEVFTQPPTQPHRFRRLKSYYHLFREKATPRGYIPDDDKWLIKATKEYRPNVLLTVTHPVKENTLFELKKLGIRRRITWWGDTPGYIKRMDLLSDEWDAIFLKDQDGVDKFRRVGLNAHMLQEAMNPAWHKPLATTKKDEVVICGNYYGYRQFIARRLIDNKIPVGLYGSPLPQWGDPVVRKQFTGKYITKEEKSRIFGEGVAVLNSTQMVEGNALNCRAFEIAGAGGLQLMDYRSAISECFEIGKELLVYHTYEELLDQIDRARKYPHEMEPIRAAGAKRALAEHTYEHRLNHIIRTVIQV